MLINTFLQLVDQGQRHFDAETELKEAIDIEERSGHYRIQFKLDNTTGQLDQLAHILSHNRSAYSTEIMAYFIIELIYNIAALNNILIFQCYVSNMFK